MIYILLDTENNKIKWRGTEPYNIPNGPPLADNILSLQQIDEPKPDYDPRLQQATRTEWYVDGNVYRRSWTLTDYTTEQVRALLRKQVTETARAIRDQATAGTSPAEMASWSLKRSEAKSFTTEPSSQIEADNMGVGLLYAEAQVRNTTTENIVTRVLTNAAALTQLEAKIAGNAGRLQDLLSKATTINDLILIDLTEGWTLDPPDESLEDLPE